ncbi:hypothetical protein ACPXCP_20285 [Streptomyces sp. DT20]|uniref:hypothetical protein n=1 Tax=Streptomyces sp. DT20 TaxID=3416519 RepID=UPI003CF97132
MTNPPYTYTDGQGHRLILDPVAGAAGTPFVRVTAEDTAIGGDIASVWLTLDQAAALDRRLSAGIACELTDHTGDTLTVTGSDDFTTFTVARQEDEDDDRANVPVVALTGRLPEIRRALTATAEQAQQHATPDAPAEAATEPTHEGPDPSHGGLTTHRGPREQCPGPDCTAEPFATVVLRPTDAPDELAATAASHGISPAAVAYGLREAAAAFDTAARAQGIEPVAPAAEQRPATGDVFTEAAVSRSVLLTGITAIEALPQDFECDPGRGDAVKLLRRLADHYTTSEQPAGLSWEARAEHAVRLYATTAIERDDARTETAQALAQRNAVFATNEQLLAQVEEAGQARIQAENAARTLRHRLTAVRTIHTKHDDSEHCQHDAESWPCPTVAALDDEDQAEPTTPALDDRYVKRNAPDAGRIVTVNRVWTAANGHTAVAYEWDDPRASYAGSACPLDVFTRTYRPEAGR